MKGKGPKTIPASVPHSVWWTAIYGQGRPAKATETVLTFYLKSGKVMAGHLAAVTVGDDPDRDFLLRDDPRFPVTVWDTNGAEAILTSAERTLVVVPASEVEYSTIGFRRPSVVLDDPAGGVLGVGGGVADVAVQSSASGGMAGLACDFSVGGACFGGDGDETRPERVAGVPVRVREACRGRETFHDHVDGFASGEWSL